MADTILCQNEVIIWYSSRELIDLASIELIKNHQLPFFYLFPVLLNLTVLLTLLFFSLTFFIIIFIHLQVRMLITLNRLLFNFIQLELYQFLFLLFDRLRIPINFSNCWFYMNLALYCFGLILNRTHFLTIFKRVTIVIDLQNFQSLFNRILAQFMIFLRFFR